MTKTLMIQGTSSGSGKTTLVTALCRIFADDGFRVAPFKSQNMSSYSYQGNDFEISRAQAIQAIAARTDISPHMNPILLKPAGDYKSQVFVSGKFYKNMHANHYYKKFALKKGLQIAKKSLDFLRNKYDIIILEGAGSPAEFNLQKYDIANMRMARHCSSPVILISDIDKGGTFASIVGTLALLEEQDRKFVRGYVINKFRGDLKILQPSLTMLHKKTKKPVFGTIPLMKFEIPEEDSLHSNPKQVSFTKKYVKSLDKEIEKLSQMVRLSLNMKAIGDLLK